MDTETQVGHALPVLLVDDDELARKLVIQHMRKLNLRNRIVEAVDGDDAIEILGGADAAALVVLDLQMPNTSGLEVLRWMRSQPRLGSLPVIMLTGAPALEDIHQAYDLGITSYLVKPVGFAGLQDVLRQLSLPWLLA